MNLKIYLLLLFVCCGNYAYAEKERTYIVGVELLNYAPLWSIDNNQYSGFSRELLDLFALKSGYRFSFRPLPINRLWFEFSSGKIDFKFPDNHAWRGALKSSVPIYYSKEVLSYIDGILVKKERLGMNSAQIKKVGIIRGFTPSSEILYSDTETLEATNIEQLFRLIQAGRIDGIYSNILVGQHLLNDHHYPSDFIVHDTTLPHSRGSYTLSSIQHPALINEFSAFLDHNQSEINQLKLKYNIPID